MKPLTGRSTPKSQITLMAVLSLVAWGALLLQLCLALAKARAEGTAFSSVIAGYFSYFTILTNLLIALTASIPLVAPASNASSFFRRPSVITGVCVCIVAGGIAYNVLLRHDWAPEGLQRVADELLHVATPVLFVIYWWLAVPRRSIKWSNLPWWLLYPLAYLGYTLLRGAFLGRYPYPFLDVSVLGYGHVAVNAAGLLAVLAVVGAGLVLIKR